MKRHWKLKRTIISMFKLSLLSKKKFIFITPRELFYFIQLRNTNI